jgi:hypothetical protein
MSDPSKRSSSGAFLANLKAGPPWPQKLMPLLRNRGSAMVHGGCCGNPGQPGC